MNFLPQRGAGDGGRTEGVLGLSGKPTYEQEIKFSSNGIIVVFYKKSRENRPANFFT